MPTITIGDYLLTRLKELGIQHIFGVVGDYNLGFLDQIINHAGLEWIGTCNELNGAYASDGYARIKGAGALVTTFGVGELSAMNGIAGAYAESVPVVNIVGTPATTTQKDKMLVHHTLGDGQFMTFAEMYKKVTQTQAFLNAENAAEEIDRALTSCWLYKKPVYIALPTDISYVSIEAAKKPLNLNYPASDPETIKKFIEHAAQIVEKATRPIVLIDLEAQRFPMQSFINDFLQRTGIPFAAMGMGKAIINESHHQFIGVYNGFSRQNVQKYVEQSDCVIAFGLLLSDFNTGGFTSKPNADVTIEIHGYFGRIQQVIYKKISFCDSIPALTKRLAKYQYQGEIVHPLKQKANTPRDIPIRQQWFWQQIASSIEKNTIVIAETGTSTFGTLQMSLPDEITYIAQMLWGSIGYTVGALLGVCVAAAQRPAVLFLGDGSLQVAAQEISTIIRHHLTPTLFLLDNAGYTIERIIHGATMPYQDIQHWNYTELPKIFGNTVWCMRVKTEKELVNALIERNKNKDKMVFITIVLDKMDIPETLSKLGKLMAQRNQYDSKQR
jgi:TPP-dependent 2-oxoacid decarboxylase